MPAKPKLTDFDRILIVEGYSDLLFYAEFLEHLGKPGLVFIKEFGGKDDLLVKLEDFITPVLLSEKTRIGVIIDGDTNPKGASESVWNKLSELTNQSAPPDGLWTGGAPALGVFITPGDDSTGEIETLVWNAWSADPGNGSSAACIEEFALCMARAGHEARSREKGLLGALLAIRNDDDPRLGPGCRTRVFDFNSPKFAKLAAFLSSF